MGCHEDEFDVYLRHLQEHQKQIVLQASQAEVNTTTFATTGLPASASSLCREPYSSDNLAPVMLQQVLTESTYADHATKLLLAKMPKTLGTLAGFILQLMGKIPCYVSTPRKRQESTKLTCHRQRLCSSWQQSSPRIQNTQGMHLLHSLDVLHFC